MTKAWVLGAFSVTILTGCLVEVDHTADPERAFRAAAAEAEKASLTAGPARELVLLAYDPDGELVRLNLPMKLLSRASAFADWGRSGSLLHGTARRIDFRAIQQAPPGPLLEVENDDGERVLVFLR